MSISVSRKVFFYIVIYFMSPSEGPNMGSRSIWRGLHNSTDFGLTRLQVLTYFNKFREHYLGCWPVLPRWLQPSLCRRQYSTVTPKIWYTTYVDCAGLPLPDLNTHFRVGIKSEQHSAVYRLWERPYGHRTNSWCIYLCSWIFICLFRFLVGQSPCNLNKVPWMMKVLIIK